MPSLFEDLPLECLLTILRLVPINTLQEIALLSKQVRSKCLLFNYDNPIPLPLSKKSYLEILLKTARVIMLDKPLVKTGYGWLRVVLNHFKGIKTIKITLKNTSRDEMVAIWKIIVDVDSLKEIMVPNCNMKKWSRFRLKHRSNIAITPLLKKDFNNDKVDISASNTVEKTAVFNGFNNFMKGAISKFESGEKLSGPFEVLALNNILWVTDSKDSNSYGIDQTLWNDYCQKSSTSLHENPQMGSQESEQVIKIINEYSTNALKNQNALIMLLTKYSVYESKSIKACLNILTHIDKVVGPRWRCDTTEEDILIKQFVDPIVLDPFFDKNMKKIVNHGNGHALPESKYRKVSQAKRNGDTLKGWKGRAPDRALEYINDGNIGFSVFICEVKTGSNSKQHPDLGKLGTMMKDILDYAFDKGAPPQYAVTGLLVEGVDCQVFSFSMPTKKLYHMERIYRFDLPNDFTELSVISEIIIPMLSCRDLVDHSCQLLQVLESRDQYHHVPTCNSPTYYTDYYT